MIHLPEDWEKVIKEACPSKPFHIQRMEKEDFLDFTPLTNHFTMRKKDSTGTPVLISNASWFNYGEGEEDGKILSHPGEYWMKSSLSKEEPWQKVYILKGRKKLHPPKEIHLQIGHQLNPNKVADLQKVVQFLPPSY